MNDGSDGEHHLVRGEDGGDRVHPSGEGLAEHEQVGLHLLVVDGEQAPDS